MVFGKIFLKSITSFFPDREKVLEEIEDLKVTCELETAKIGFGFLFIVVSAYGLHNLVTPIIPEMPSWGFTLLFSLLFSLLMFGLNLTINGLTSNAARNKKFQDGVNRKLAALISRGTPPENIQEAEETMTSQEKSNKFGETLIKIGFAVFIVVYIIWFVWTMSQHSNDSQYITTAILAIPTLVVAVVTYMYVLLTRDLVKINQDLVNAQKQPIFSLDIENREGCRVVNLWNTGEVARNVTIIFTANWDFQQPSINLLSLKRDSQCELLDNISQILGNGHIWTVTVDYENIFSQHFHEVFPLSNEKLQSLGTTRIIIPGGVL